MSAFSYSAGQLPATLTNDSAAVGKLGEFIEGNLAIGSATALTTNTAKTVTSISLTAGDWDLWGHAGYVNAAATVITVLLTSISETNNTRDTANEFVTAWGSAGITGGSNPMALTPIVRKSLSATTTIYLVAQAGFTTDTLTVWGTIRARRRR